jgi:hypothetical protein
MEAPKVHARAVDISGTLRSFVTVDRPTDRVRELELTKTDNYVKASYEHRKDYYLYSTNMIYDSDSSTEDPHSICLVQE